MLIIVEIEIKDIPQIQLGLLHFLTYTSKLIMKAAWLTTHFFAIKKDDSNFSIMKVPFITTFQQHLYMTW
jgi:hypothetical protein